MDSNTCIIMKKLLTIIFLLPALIGSAQSPTLDTLRYKDGRGKLWQVISYGSDSVDINGVRLYSGTPAFINYWQPAGTGAIQPNPANTIIKYPDIPMWNMTIHSMVDAPVWYDFSTKMLRAKTNFIIFIKPNDTLGGPAGYGAIFQEPDSTVTVYVDSIAHITTPVTVKNEGGSNSYVIIKSLEGLQINDKDSVILADKEWIEIYPATTKFIIKGNTWVTDSSLYYLKAVADTHFVTATTRDSLFRYSVYSSGNNNIEVLATKKGITATLANSNEFTFSLPTGVDLISAKIRVENFSSVVCIMSGKLGAASMATRWMPSVSAWREDTGAQLMGVASRMDLSVFSKFYITGLISTAKCQVRIVF